MGQCGLSMPAERRAAGRWRQPAQPGQIAVRVALPEAGRWRQRALTVMTAGVTMRPLLISAGGGESRCNTGTVVPL